MQYPQTADAAVAEAAVASFAVAVSALSAAGLSAADLPAAAAVHQSGPAAGAIEQLEVQQPAVVTAETETVAAAAVGCTAMLAVEQVLVEFAAVAVMEATD